MQSRGRRRFQSSQQVASAVIILALCLIAFWVYRRGQSFDPALFAGVIRTTADSSAAAHPDALLNNNLPAAGWLACGSVAVFPADRMYEKINGKADAYLEYGAFSLETRAWCDPDDENRFFEAYVFDMGSDLNAMGIYQRMRPAGETEPITVGTEGYRASGSCFFYLGRYYAEISVAGQESDLHTAALALAESIASALPAAAPLAEDPLKILPVDHRLPDSATLNLGNAFGQAFIPHAVSARYQWQDNVYLAFVTDCTTANQARELFDLYVQYIQHDGDLLEHQQEGQLLAVGEIFGFFDLVVVDGPLLIGIREAEELEPAREFLAWFRSQVTQPNGDQEASPP